MGRFFIGFINLIIKGIGGALGLVTAILPPSPFKLLDNSVISSYLPTLNYFIPISSMISIGELWLVAVGTYYIVQIALRWIKAIN